MRLPDLQRVERGAKSFRKGRLILHATILPNFELPSLFVGLFYSSLIHDAPAPCSAGTASPCPAHMGIPQKSDTDQEPPWAHLSAHTLSISRCSKGPAIL